MKKVVYNVSYGGFGLSDKAISWLIERGKTKEWCEEVEYNDLYRSDPFLVECIETLGFDAESKYANLEIATIEDNTYSIVETDGVEEVLTPNEIN